MVEGTSDEEEEIVAEEEIQEGIPVRWAASLRPRFVEVVGVSCPDEVVEGYEVEQVDVQVEEARVARRLQHRRLMHSMASPWLSILSRLVVQEPR